MFTGAGEHDVPETVARVCVFKYTETGGVVKNGETK